MNFNGVIYINSQNWKGHGFVICEIKGNPRGRSKEGSSVKDHEPTIQM